MTADDARSLLELLKQSDTQTSERRNADSQALFDLTDRQIAQIAAYKALEDGSPDAGVAELVASLGEGADPT